MASTDSGARPARTPDFELSLDELRAVTAFNLACAGHIEPMSRSAAEAVVLGEANATVGQVLHRCPPASSRGRDVGEVLAALDARLRVDMAGDSLRPGIGDVSI